MKRLGPHIATAAFAQGASALLGKVATIVATVLLARMLFPEDFGLQTVAFMMLGLVNMFSNFGFQTYIIQAKELSPEKLDTCHTLNIVFSVVLGGCMAVAGYLLPTAPPLLREMLYLYGTLVFISGLTYSQLAMMKRHLRFKESARAEVTYSLVSNTGRVAFAYAGLGALCFPMGDLLGALARWWVTRKVVTDPPKMRMPTGAVSKEVLGFGAHTTSVGLASFVANQVDKALLAVSHSIAQVGVYGFATTMAAMFYNAIIVPQSSVFMAAFARLQDDVAAVRQLLATSSRFIFSMAMPLNVLWLLEAEAIISVVFGVQWLPAAPIIRILAVDFMVRSMFTGITGLLLSFGRAADAARTKWTNTSIFVTLMAIAWGAELDLQGYAMMFVAANLVATWHNVHVNGKLIDFRLGPYLVNLAVPASIALVCTVTWWLVYRYAPPGSPTVSLILRASSWLLAYLVLTIVFNHVVVNHCLVILKLKRRSKE